MQELTQEFAKIGKCVMENTNYAMRHLLCTHCRSKRKSNTAMRRVQANRRPIETVWHIE